MLKLPNTPAARPGADRLGHIPQVLAGFLVFFPVEGVPVDVLGNVLGNVAGSAALALVDGLEVKTGFAGLERPQLLLVFRAGVFVQDAAQRLEVGGEGEQQHVPVRRAIMMRFDDAEAEHAYPGAGNRRAGLSPHPAQVFLRVARVGTVPLFDKAATAVDGVVF